LIKYTHLDSFTLFLGNCRETFSKHFNGVVWKVHLFNRCNLFSIGATFFLIKSASFSVFGAIFVGEMNINLKFITKKEKKILPSALVMSIGVQRE
jgi:hypothetical protein